MMSNFSFLLILRGKDDKGNDAGVSPPAGAGRREKKEGGGGEV